MRGKAELAVKAARQDGDASRISGAKGFWEDPEANRQALNGGLLLLRDGTYASCWGVRKKGTDGHNLLVREKKEPSAHEKDSAWLTARVDKVWPAIVTQDGKAGSKAAGLVHASSGLPVEFSLVMADPISQAVLTPLEGTAGPAKDVATVLASISGQGEAMPWGGGLTEPRLRSGDGIPDPTTAESKDGVVLRSGCCSVARRKNGEGARGRKNSASFSF